MRPFYAIDGSNVQAGVDVSMQLYNESEREFQQSALFLFFKGRIYRLKVHNFYMCLDLFIFVIIFL